MDEDKCPKVIDQALGQDYADCDARAQKVAPADIIAALTEDQCDNLKNNKGIYGTGDTNCDDIQGELLCDIRQDLEAVLVNQSLTIFANDFSKCSDTDENPTLASMWSRIYRFSQAITCILCAYDPFISVLLKSGRYPQVLMGAVSDQFNEDDMGCHKTGYPVWVNPDTIPVSGSGKPVTSDGVFKAIEEAILGVWHLWTEHPHFSYYATHETQGRDPLSDATGMAEGDTALVKENDAGEFNVIYVYRNGAWEKEEVLGVDGVDNFSVTNIDKGAYANNEIYYFHTGGVPTWQMMDASLSELEERIERLESMYAQGTVTSADSNAYVITTRATVTAAMSVPPTQGKVTLVFITG